MALLRSLLRDRQVNHTEFDHVMHHRSHTGAEIDFVGRNFGSLAIESEYVDSRWRRRSGRTLTASQWRGLVATRSKLNLDNSELAAVPTAILAWLIDS